MYFPPDARRLFVLSSFAAFLFWITFRPLATASNSAEQQGESKKQRTTGGVIDLPPPYQTPSARNNPKVIARPAGATLRVPPGFRIDEYAGGFNEGRWMALSPNGDVFVSEHKANRITILRDPKQDGKIERRVFAEGLNQPFGMAFHPQGWFYVGNTDSVVRFRYKPGQLKAEGAPEKIADLPGNGYNQHWTRNVIFSPDYKKMYVSVGSESNVNPEKDPRRAAIGEYDIDGKNHRIFASGLRNAIGMAFYPGTRTLWAAVNERDLLGDDLVPDYLTSVREGGFYGWPYSYFGQNEDPRRKGERPDLVAKAIVPDLALGSHVAALGLVFYQGSQFPRDYQGDALIAEHGSWNRSHKAGYKVVRARFKAGKPTGQLEDLAAGWLTADEKVWGRPVGLLQLPDGTVLVTDDGANKIWRISYAGGRL